MNIEEQPLVVRETCIKLAYQVRDYHYANLKELVKIVKNTGDYIELKDVNRNFYLIISDPKQSASNVKNVTFIVTTMPSSDLHLAASGTPYNSEVVLKGIEDWVKRIKRFNAAEKQR